MNRSIPIIFAALLLSIASMAQSTSVFDASYFATDNSEPPIKIGKGFHINDIYRQTKNCFTIETSNQSKLVPQQTGGTKTTIKLYYTRTNAEYNNLKTRGSSGKVNFLNLFNLGGQKLEEYSKVNMTNQEKLIFTASVDFGIFSFEREPTLNPDAKTLITQQKLKDFVSLYGTHYISGVRKESNITVILTKENTSSNEEESSKTSFSANANIPFKGSGNFELGNNGWANKKLDESRYGVEIEINGPTFSSASLEAQIDGILNGSSDAKATAISNLINSVIGEISDIKQSSITQYYYAPFDLYGLKGIVWNEKKQSQLAKINEAVISTYSVKAEVDNLLSSSGKRQFEEELSKKKLSSEQLDQILNTFNNLQPDLQLVKKKCEKYLEQLEENYLQCADVYCDLKSDCCQHQQFLDEISADNLDNQVQEPLKKLLTVTAQVNKEINKPDCEKRQQGIITVENLSSNPYILYNGNSLVEVIPANGIKRYFVNTGHYQFRAVQKSGYVLYATVNNRPTNINTVCQEVKIQIGFEDK